MRTGLFLEFPALEDITDQQAFQQGFQIAEEAERLGVESVWLAEYHFIPFSVLSSPVMVATAIAGRTERIRIGLGVLLLPLGNPIRIAEEIATLDHICQGRLDFGVGRGTFPEHHDAFLSPYPESRGRFEEYLEIILKSWTTEQFSFEGEHYKCYDLAVRPKPYQKPHPPIRIGVTSAETFPIIGRMGYPLFVNPSRVFALDDLAEHVHAYQKAWKDAGHPGRGSIGIRLPVYLADTEAKAYEEPRASMETQMTGLWQRVAASADRVGTTGNWQAESDHVKSMTYDDWLRDKVVVGTPESVLDRLLQLTEDLQLSHIVFEHNSGRRIPHDLQMKSVRLLMDKVVPHLP